MFLVQPGYVLIAGETSRLSITSGHKQHILNGLKRRRKMTHRKCTLCAGIPRLTDACPPHYCGLHKSIIPMMLRRQAW